MAVEHSANETKITRREFLDVMLKGLAGAGFLGAVGAVVSYLSPPQQKMLGAGEPLAVADEGTIPENTGQVVAYGSEKVLLVHTAEGYTALSAVCTHAGCLVLWDSDSKRVHCPCHDGFFDLQGNVMSGPPPRPLKVYRAEVQGDKVLVSGA